MKGKQGKQTFPWGGDCKTCANSICKSSPAGFTSCHQHLEHISILELAVTRAWGNKHKDTAKPGI